MEPGLRKRPWYTNWVAVLQTAENNFVSQSILAMNIVVSEVMYVFGKFCGSWVAYQNFQKNFLNFSHCDNFVYICWQLHKVNKTNLVFISQTDQKL